VSGDVRSTVTRMAGKVAGFGLAAMLLVGLTACGGGGGPSATSVTSTTAPPATLNGFSECTFAAGAPAMQAGLASVGGRALAVSWDTPSDVSTPDSAVFVITLGRRYKIGFRRGGAEGSRYVVDLRTKQQTSLTTSFTETDDGISMVVPGDAIPTARTPTTWSAAVTDGGRDIARCPAKGTQKFGSKPEADITDPG
jgi:hypothetical protein